MQYTPLVSRSGQLLGMISTHWRAPHQPTERALQRFDVLARQAADLVERTRNEAEPPERNQQLLELASVVESSDDAIATKNLDGVITSWNRSAERLFGYAAEDIIGESVAILLPPGRHDEEHTILERIKRRERIEAYETVRQRKDGKLIDISLTVSPVRNAQGEITGASKIAIDITERKRNDAHVATLARSGTPKQEDFGRRPGHRGSFAFRHPHGLKRAIAGRVTALARLQDLFVKSRWTGAELSSIASQELAPSCGEGAARVRIDGPHVLLRRIRRERSPSSCANWRRTR